MAKNKTIETQSSVSDYIMAIANEKKRLDFETFLEIIANNTGLEPKMWGTAIVGFGNYHYKYESGREGDSPVIGIAARANAITFYLGFFAQKDNLLSKLGKYKFGKSCIYIQKIEDIDTDILVEMVKNAANRKEK